MKPFLTTIMVSALLYSVPAGAAFYQWIDDQGVIHFTDSRTNIPKQYQGRARRVEVESAPTVPEPQTQRVLEPSPLTAPGGHGETWWRERYKALRSELKTLQDGRAEKEQQLEELRRKRTLFHRAEDRVAINVMEAKIADDDAKIGDMLNRITALDLAAAQAGVPVEWRQ